MLVTFAGIFLSMKHEYRVLQNPTLTGPKHMHCRGSETHKRRLGCVLWGLEVFMGTWVESYVRYQGLVSSRDSFCCLGLRVFVNCRVLR